MRNYHSTKTIKEPSEMVALYNRSEKMPEKLYSCGYNHCLHPNDKVKQESSVLIGKRRYHKECAKMREKIENIKRIYFDYIDDKSDYVQVVGVINNLIFKKNYDVDYVEFMMKYLAVYGRNIKSPYALHTIIKQNDIIKKKYSNEKLRKDVISRFDYRTGIN